MKKLAIAAIGLVLAGFAFAGDQPNLREVQKPQPNSVFIHGEFLPTLPPGWTLINVESVTTGGTNTAFVQMFLLRPATGQTGVWLVQLQIPPP